MPQEIPLEASETLVFTPACLAEHIEPPRFTLRAVTRRDRRYFDRLPTEEGVVYHPPEALRREMELGLRKHWTQEQFDKFFPKVEAYWEQRDRFDEQRRDDDSLVWQYDADEEQAVLDLLDGIAQVHKPIRVMEADNRDYLSQVPLFRLAVCVTGWTGLDTKIELDRGYLSLDCVDAMVGELGKKSENLLSKKSRGMPLLELLAECLNRMRLDKDTEKNSPSPSQGGSPRTSSKTESGPSSSPDTTDENSKSDETKQKA